MKYFLSGITLLLIPLILAICMNFNIFSHTLGDANGWLGYWGGYLGALIGAATVFILTQKQLKIQEKLHEDSLANQLKLHKENLVQQENLQIKNIKVTSEIEDKRQRDLIIANLSIQKIDKLVVEIISLNELLSKRFNILRNFGRLHLKREKLFRKILKEGRRRSFMEKYNRLIYKGNLLTTSPFKKISKRRLLKIRRSQLGYKDNIDLVNKYQKQKFGLLDEETVVRNKIISSSATIKSDSMFVDLDDNLNLFREKITKDLGFFYNLLENNQLINEEFLTIVDNFQEELMELSNKSIEVCKKTLKEELDLLKTN